ncbi:MAG: hypothetical protein V4819_18025, partial [Verrucomicrobiota bacterium]
MGEIDLRRVKPTPAKGRLLVGSLRLDLRDNALCMRLTGTSTGQRFRTLGAHGLQGARDDADDQRRGDGRAGGERELIA